MRLFDGYSVKLVNYCHCKFCTKTANDIITFNGVIRGKCLCCKTARKVITISTSS